MGNIVCSIDVANGHGSARKLSHDMPQRTRDARPTKFDQATDHASGNQDRQQANKPLNHERARRKPVSQSLMIGIGQHEPAQHEEEVHSEITARHQERQLGSNTEMIRDHRYRSHTAQPIQQREVSLGCNHTNSWRRHREIHNTLPCQRMRFCQPFTSAGMPPA
jgi:hypothetical protein